MAAGQYIFQGLANLGNAIGQRNQHAQMMQEAKEKEAAEQNKRRKLWVAMGGQMGMNKDLLDIADADTAEGAVKGFIADQVQQERTRKAQMEQSVFDAQNAERANKEAWMKAVQEDMANGTLSPLGGERPDVDRQKVLLDAMTRATGATGYIPPEADNLMRAMQAGKESPYIDIQRRQVKLAEDRFKAEQDGEYTAEDFEWDKKTGKPTGFKIPGGVLPLDPSARIAPGSTRGKIRVTFPAAQGAGWWDAAPAAVSYKSAEEVRDAYTSGKIDREMAKKIIESQFSNAIK